MLRDAHDEVHVVLDQEHGDAGLLDAANDLAELMRLLRVEAGSRLVEQQQLRLRGKRAGDLEPPLQAVRQALRRLMGALAETEISEQRQRIGPRRRFRAPA
jgi:hypothetical protein